MDDKTLVEVTEADKRAAQNAFDSVAWGCPDSEMWCFVQAFAAHRIEAAKAERDRLHFLDEKVAQSAIDALPDWSGLLPSDLKEIAAALADALESQP